MGMPWCRCCRCCAAACCILLGHTRCWHPLRCPSEHHPIVCSCAQIAAADAVLCKGISSRRLQLVASGSGLPVIDLSKARQLRCLLLWSLQRVGGMLCLDCVASAAGSMPVKAGAVLPEAPSPLFSWASLACPPGLSRCPVARAQISAELAAAAQGADLVVLEGMGRSIETNLHARLRCVLVVGHGAAADGMQGGILWQGGEPCCVAACRGSMAGVSAAFHSWAPPSTSASSPQLRPAEHRYDQAPRGGGGARRPPLRLRVPVQARGGRRQRERRAAGLMSVARFGWAPHCGGGGSGCLPHAGVSSAAAALGAHSRPAPSIWCSLAPEHNVKSQAFTG